MSHNMHEAQLYWDKTPDNPGWYLRYRDAQGGAQGCEVEAEKDATTAELAFALQVALGDQATCSGTVKVYRGDEHKGAIVLADGAVVEWRAG